MPDNDAPPGFIRLRFWQDVDQDSRLFALHAITAIYNPVPDSVGFGMAGRTMVEIGRGNYWLCEGERERLLAVLNGRPL